MSSTQTDRIDGLSTSVAVKAPVRVVTNAAITLSGEQTINGVAVSENDRVLVKNQTDQTENGIYDVKSTAWVRAKDFDGTRDVRKGTVVLVAGSPFFYRVTTADPILIGTSSLTFTVDSEGETLSISNYNLTQDGSTDDATELNDAFTSAAGKSLLFPENKTIAFASALTIQANTTIHWGGSTLKLTATINSPNVAITVGNGCKFVGKLTIQIPTGVICDRPIAFGDDCEIEYVYLESTDQQNNRDASGDGGIRVSGDRTAIHKAHVKNFDNAYTFEQCDDLDLGTLTWESYVRGQWFHDCVRPHQGFAACHTKSVNGTTDPGHNAQLITDCQYGFFGDVLLQNAGEHCIRVGGDTLQRDLAWGVIKAIRPGQCGLKLAGDAIRITDVTVAALHVTDCSFGGASSSNEDGLRAEEVDGLAVGVLTVKRKENAGRSCFNGIYLQDCTNVTIPGPQIDSPSDSGIWISGGSDINIPEAKVYNCGNHGAELVDTHGAMSRIDLDGLDVTLAAGDGLAISSPIEIMRNIYCRGLCVTAASGYDVSFDMGGGAQQPVIIEGSVQGFGTGVLSTTGTDVDATIHLRKQSEIQTLTGAGAVDPWTPITHVVTTGANALTLADAYEGARKFVVMKTDVGAGTLTPDNLGNGSTITFDDVGDSADLLFTNAAWHFLGGTATLA